MTEIKRVSDCIVNMDEDGIIEAIDNAIKNGISIDDIYEKGLSDGMLKVTELFENKEYYIPEVIVCADTLKKGIEYLRTKGGEKHSHGPKVMIAVVEGDHHEIGKNIVKIMLESANFQVIDLGLNVRAKEIVEKAIEEDVDVIGLSTMMTTTMGAMKEVVDLLNKEECLKKRLPKVIIGGGCISQKYADEIDCDGYARNAVEGVTLIRKLMRGDNY
ncbi:cobalamin B12-binding domain-containing protein [Senegalia sp. (in: firmicutes)]|uniref:cobalamin B12-binding domain-containing protein n=1 Tax=Senegalia sp. (in: firmicutes) TaxID=1924098 RepID=UPI003F9B9A03